MARDVLLDYVFTAQAREVIGPASRSYLHNVMVVAPALEGVEATVAHIADKSELAQYTTNAAGISELFNAGVSFIYLAVGNTIQEAAAQVESAPSNWSYFTVLIDPAFKSVAPNAELNDFTGVKGWTTNDDDDARNFDSNIFFNNTAFRELDSTTDGGNMYYAFGRLLSGATWRNLQYIAMPRPGATESLGIAELWFQNRHSFVLQSEEFGSRLAFFVNRGRAITAPYLYEEIQLDLQSWSLTYINANMPDYTDVEAAKIEAYLQKKANTKYVDTGLVETIGVNVRADQDNFVMSGNVGISEPKATWRIKAEIIQGVENGE